MYDTLDLTVAEIDAMLGGAPEPTAEELSARVAHRKALSEPGRRRSSARRRPPPPLDGCRRR